MAEGSPIGWLAKPGHIPMTGNVVLGCKPRSTGCRLCFAPRSVVRQAHLPGRDGIVTHTDDGRLAWTGLVKMYPERVAAFRSKTKPHMIFVTALGELFDPQVTFEFLVELWQTMAATPQHTYVILTKLAGRMYRLVTRLVEMFGVLPNVWLGVSAENQAMADNRLPWLMRTPAAIRVVSCEPMVGPINLRPWLGGICGCLEDESGRQDLPGDRVWGVADRRAGTDLEGGGAASGSLVRNDQDDPLHAAPCGAPHRGVSAGPGDVRRAPVSCDGSPVGMEALLRINTAGFDGQPQERHQDGQSAGEPRVGDLEGTNTSCAGGSSAWSAGPVRRAQHGGQADHSAGSEDLRTPRGRRAATCPRCGLRRTGADNIQDHEGMPSLSWVIVGGESGRKDEARAMHPVWARNLIAQVHQAGIAVFLKQWGSWGPAPWVARVCDPQQGWHGTDEELAAAKKRAEAIGATHSLPVWADRYGMLPRDVGHKPWSGERCPLAAGEPHAPLRFFQGTSAGHAIDGRTWQQWPDGTGGIIDISETGLPDPLAQQVVLV